ncbi:MAG: hypothetical protein N3G21_03605 [Candidatus Hydrogenedentes bacterium]|nr:hypothetical protein [Candidatus Hydrogenedentota bacterium]
MSFALRNSLPIHIPDCWWRLAYNSTGLERYRYSEDFFNRLGWETFTPLPETKTMRELGCFNFLLATPNQKTLQVIIVPKDSIYLPSKVKNNYLDFCPLSRILLQEIDKVYSAFIFITDFSKFHLYSLRDNTLILWADYPAQFIRDIAPYLLHENVTKDVLEEIPRVTKSIFAKEIRDWFSYWHKKLLETVKLPEEKTDTLLDRFIVLHNVFTNMLFPRMREVFESRFLTLVDEATWGSTNSNIGEELVALFHDIWFHWRIAPFQIDTEIDSILTESTIALEILQNFPLLSPQKFEMPVILESFNFGDAQERMRIRMIPEPNPEREMYLKTQTKNTIDNAKIEIDIRDEGYRAILFWFDRLIKCYEDIEESEFSETSTNTKDTEDDLLSWGINHNSKPSALKDKIGYACTNGFKILYQTSRQLRIAKLILTLHLIEIYAKRDLSVEKFPPLEQIFIHKPAIIPSERAITSKFLKTSTCG